ncbi:hypothetical protein DOTSEDRAFT_71975 [Dothistroma septosporum NZE10]|uniref:Uncharacterized protein n=1 Tax=Dothistroma septosporum (strain NZE10 / CBS 128990) TaxID=675120 RepID=N1PLU2_DOTSN|nr:hypothetical protein DOTSEDRAFT_71975 [Dothistroma septosporum NZE10]
MRYTSTRPYKRRELHLVSQTFCASMSSPHPPNRERSAAQVKASSSQKSLTIVDIRRIAEVSIVQVHQVLGDIRVCETMMRAPIVKRNGAVQQCCHLWSSPVCQIDGPSTALPCPARSRTPFP